MNIKEALKKQGNNIGLIALLILITIFFGSINSAFHDPSNLIQYLNNGVVLSFLTLGLAVTVITGNFDYSIGSMTGFGTVVLALMIKNGVPIWLALPIGFLLLQALGVINGLLVGYLRIPGMLATLGTSSLIYGISLVLTQGQAVGSDSMEYRFFGESNIGTLPFGMILLVIVFALSWLLAHRTRLGRRWVLIGTSPEVARFAGISYAPNVLFAHMYSAAMCFFGALILGSQMASGRADIGAGYVLQAITAAVFGGVSIKGGEGSLFGALLGVLVFTLLTSGFTMIDMSQYYKQITTGVLLILVLCARNMGRLFPRDNIMTTRPKVTAK